MEKQKLHNKWWLNSYPIYYKLVLSFFNYVYKSIQESKEVMKMEVMVETEFRFIIWLNKLTQNMYRKYDERRKKRKERKRKKNLRYGKEELMFMCIWVQLLVWKGITDRIRPWVYFMQCFPLNMIPLSSPCLGRQNIT